MRAANRSCKQCGESILGFRSDAKFCSDKCRKGYDRRKEKLRKRGNALINEKLSFIRIEMGDDEELAKIARYYLAQLAVPTRWTQVSPDNRVVLAKDGQA